MRAIKLQSKKATVLKEIPEKLSDSEVLTFLKKNDITWEHIKMIKDLTGLNDEVISEWLNVSVRTIRSYKQPNNKFKENMKEQILLLLSLIRHGIKVFGTQETFKSWLNTGNFFFDNVSPVAFLNTVTGVRFVDDRLTAMEFGDNV